MRLVIIETPFAASDRGVRARNLAYARACMHDSLKRGEAPFLSHLLYTQVLDDTKGQERVQGIEAGLAWGAKADGTVVYTDLGISPGMKLGITRAEGEGRAVEYRRIGLPWTF